MTDDLAQIIAELRAEGVAWCNEATYAALLNIVEAAQTMESHHGPWCDAVRTYLKDCNCGKAELDRALSALAKTRMP